MVDHDPDQRFATIVQKLRAYHYKLTPQRLAVARILARSKGHPTVEAIYDQLQDDFPTMSLATVYRNVMLMKSLGEVLELGFPEGGNRYDGNRPYPHPHVICLQCKKILDPELHRLNDLTRAVTAASGFKVLTHRMDFFGICGACQSETHS
ncbi:MAG: transcriptional repressor [Desulfobacterales bacterium]|jgi:Fur family peroxide stress response transcriptional regulator